MYPTKRPKPGETEEDLLREEKEFLGKVKSQNITPAAKVARVQKPGTSESAKQENGPEESGKNEEMEGRNESIEIEYPNETVMFDIREREFEPSKLKDFVKSDMSAKVLRVRSADVKDDGPSGAGGKRKKSLFAKSFDARQDARRREREEKRQDNLPKISEKTKESEVATNPTVPNSEVIGDKIHPLLAGMTSEDILQEQQKLIERLDPKLVEFIRNRHLNKSSSGSPPQPQQPSSSTSQACQGPNEEQMDVELAPLEIDEKDLPIDPKTVEVYPGMQKVEKAKLAWAGVIEDVEKDENVVKVQPSGSKNARFDFMGTLLPDDKVNDPTTYEKALHHHGEEMERPGYTIEELLILARSTNMQQRSVALDTLGNIYAQAHTGIYDEILEKSIFNLLDYMDFIHVIRKGLDNTDSASINSALFCLSSLLYVEHEEACLDATYLWPKSRPFPLLTTKPEEMKEDAESDMKDFEYLQLDLLDFLVSRTQVLTRIEYLLNSKSDLFNEKGITSVLKILIRLARHSPFTVLCHERILKYVVENHVSANWFLLQDRDRNLKGIPLVHALKLIRVLIESSSSNAMKLYQSYNIFPSVMAYVAYDKWKEQSHVEEVENLVLESFKIWLSFLDHGIGIDEYVALFPVLMQFLRFYGLSSELNSFDLHHSAHLFALLTQVICFGSGGSSLIKSQNVHSHWELVKDAFSQVEQHCVKILKILPSPHHLERYSSDLALLSLGKGLEFLNFGLNYLAHKDFKGRWIPLLIEFSKSRTYSNLTDNLMSHSVILQEAQEKTRYPSNFASIGAVKWEGELNPVMRTNSPYYFLSYLITLAKLITPEAHTIVLNPSIDNYLLRLQPFNKSAEECDYFLRFELEFLNVLLTSLPKEHPVKFPVVYKSLALVPSSCIKLFKSLLKESLQTCCKPQDVDAIYPFYLGLFLPNDNEILEEEASQSSTKSTKVRFDDGGHPGDGKHCDSELLFKHWSSKFVEMHWIFHPLENLYKRAVSTPGYVKDNISILEQETRGCLSFIQHCLRHYCNSIIQSSQDLVTVYCRICRVFMLGNPNVYIDELTMPILKEILQSLVSSKVLSSSNKCIFSKRKPSRSAAVSFYDFYSELVTEYFDNSYFNEVFASFLFLPLRPSEDVNVKGCFWSHEQLTFVRLTEDMVSISSEYLTRDQEKDPKMLKVFTELLRRKIILKERNPFLFKVVRTHLTNSVEFMSDEIRKHLDNLALE